MRLRLNIGYFKFFLNVPFRRAFKETLRRSVHLYALRNFSLNSSSNIRLLPLPRLNGVFDKFQDLNASH